VKRRHKREASLDRAGVVVNEFSAAKTFFLECGLKAQGEGEKAIYRNFAIKQGYFAISVKQALF
jgi:hypothetical protein